MADKQPSFAERAETMRVAANNLLATGNLLAKIAQDIDTEARLMAAAQQRFAERRGQKSERRTR